MRLFFFRETRIFRHDAASVSTFRNLRLAPATLSPLTTLSSFTTLSP